MSALFGPGTPYATAFEAIAGALAYRDRWQNSDASWAHRDNAAFVDRVRAIVNCVNADARRIALSDKSFSSSIMPSFEDREANFSSPENYALDFSGSMPSGSEPAHVRAA